MAGLRIRLIGLGAGALVCALGAAAWWTMPRRSEFYTDAESIRQRPEEARLRDVLWRPPARLARGVNGDGDEVDPRMDAGGETMYFARRGPDGDCDLYVVRRTGSGEWETPRALAGLNTLDNELGPTPSPDGRWLYFSSDRPGGLGGFDLWRAPMVDSGAWGTPERLSEGVNSARNDGWPAIDADGARMVFASDREGSYDLFAGAIGDAGVGRVERLDGVCSEEDEVAPAFSPVGDFLYFASDRSGGRGGFDLFRARLVGGEFAGVEALGGEVNSRADDLDPTLSMGGFELHFSSNRVAAGSGDDARYDIFETTSREVFLGEEIRRGDLWALLTLAPWILAALALVLLLSMLRRLSADEAWRVRWGTLSLMAKCVLFSLLAHAALLAMLSLWQVRANSGDRVADSEVGVSLTSRALSAAVESQMRGGLGELPDEPIAEAPTPTIRTASTLPGDARRADLAPGATPVIERATPLAGAGTIAEAPTPATETTPARALASPALSRVPGRSVAELMVTPRTSTRSRVSKGEPAMAVRVDSDMAPGVAAAHVEAPGAGSMPAHLDVASSSVVERQDAVGRLPAVIEAGEASVPTPSPVRPLGQASMAPDGRLALEVALPGVAGAERERVVAEPSIGDGPDHGALIPAPRAATALGDVASRSRTIEIAPGVRVASGVPEPAPVGEASIEDSTFAPGVSRSGARATEAPPRTGGFEVALPTVREREVSPAPRLRITGIVADRETREPVAGATVRLDVEGRRPLTIESDATGAFVLSPDRVPDHCAVTASKPGYVPAAMNVSERDFERGGEIVLLLERHDPFVIALEERPEVHHLGNDEFSGRVNSQFQRRSEGTRLAMVLEIDGGLLGRAAGARLVLLAKGVQLDNPVLINGRRLRHTLPASPSDGSFDEVVLHVPLTWLVEGRNVIEFRSVNSPTTDVDDYEFVNVRLVLQPGEVGL